jgi:hypothetical protein
MTGLCLGRRRLLKKFQSDYSQQQAGLIASHRGSLVCVNNLDQESLLVVYAIYTQESSFLLLLPR